MPQSFVGKSSEGSRQLRTPHPHRDLNCPTRVCWPVLF